MAKVEHITVDKTELILMVKGKNKYQTLHITYDQIQRIGFYKCSEFSLLKLHPVPSEKIEIVSSKSNQPIVYTKMQEQPYFDEYKRRLAEFAHNNRITFVDETFI